MSVTDIVHDEEIYDNDEWKEVDADTNKQIEKYNRSYNRFLFYAWGVFVTAYARHNLWSGILQFKDDYLYSDTDSIKAKNYKKHMDYINSYNKNIVKKLETCLDYYHIDRDEISPKDIKGNKHTLGLWDFEGVYTRFKTLGAKRYIVTKYDDDNNEVLEITIAGLPKDKGRDYLLKISDNDFDKVFNNFTNGFKVPKEYSGKLAAFYDDDVKEGIVKDYQGHYTKVKSLSSVHLSKESFEMTMSAKYIKLLEMIENGEVFIKDWSYKQGD